MYLKEILGGWDLQESDFSSRGEWLLHLERSTPEYHEREAKRLASLNEKKRQEAASLREAVAEMYSAIGEGEKFTFTRKENRPSGAVRLINLKIGGKPVFWELLNVSALSFLTPAFSQQEAEIIVKGFLKVISEAAGIEPASKVESREVSKWEFAYDLFP